MSFFNKKETCVNCKKKIAFNKFKTADGWICHTCYKKCGYNMMIPIKTKTRADIRNDFAKKDLQKSKLSNFNATKKIGKYIEFDEAKRQWLLLNSLFGSKKNSHVYSYDDIVDYELLEDEDTIIQGGSRRAIVEKSIIKSLKIKITVKDFQSPHLYIYLINIKTKTESLAYETYYGIAKEILSMLALTHKRNHKQKKIY